MPRTAFKVETSKTTHSGTPLFYYEEDFGFLSDAIKEVMESAEYHGGMFLEPEKVEKTLDQKGYFKASRVRSFDIVYVKIALVEY